MKEFRFRPLIALILMMCCTLGYAQKLEIDGLVYQVLNSDRKWVCVSGVENASIAAVNIPSSVVINGEEYMVTSLGDWVFWGCSSLTSIDLPDRVTNIGDGAFLYCSSLTSIDLPDGVTNIGDGAFRGCSSLTSIDLPDGVTNIGKSAFGGCSSLTSITIPNSVTSIGETIFYDCESLTQIKVDSGNPFYDSRNNCNAIIETKSNTLIAGCAKTIIPRGVKSIGYGVFSGCKSLTSITIPSSVTSIGEWAFERCNLTSITIPNSVKSIGYGAFGGCDKLTQIKVAPGNPVYDSRNNCNAIIETKSNTLIQGCAKTIIPNSVTAIGKEAFEDCRSLTSITIPSSVTSIGDDVFQGCVNLKTITIPEHFYDLDLYRWGVQVGAKIIWKGKTDKEPSRSIIYEGPQIDDLKNDQVTGGSIIY